MTRSAARRAEERPHQQAREASSIRLRTAGNRAATESPPGSHEPDHQQDHEQQREQRRDERRHDENERPDVLTEREDRVAEPTRGRGRGRPDRGAARVDRACRDAAEQNRGQGREVGLEARLAGEEDCARGRRHHRPDGVQGVIDHAGPCRRRSPPSSSAPRTRSAGVEVRSSNGAASSTTSSRASSAPPKSGSQAFRPAAPESPKAARRLPSAVSRPTQAQKISGHQGFGRARRGRARRLAPLPPPSARARRRRARARRR